MSEPKPPSAKQMTLLRGLPDQMDMEAHSFTQRSVPEAEALRALIADYERIKADHERLVQACELTVRNLDTLMIRGDIGEDDIATTKRWAEQCRLAAARAKETRAEGEVGQRCWCCHGTGEIPNGTDWMACGTCTGDGIAKIAKEKLDGDGAG